MGYIGAIVGAVGSIAGGALKAFGGSGGTPQLPHVNLSTVSLSDPNAALGQYAYQETQLPGAAATANMADVLSNKNYQQNLLNVDPNLIKQISQIGSLATSYLGGQIPQDVQDQIQRATAQQSMQGGYAGTQMGRNLTLRDLGLTSINAQQMGMNMAGVAAGMARGVNPSFTPVSSLLFTPSQLLARTDQAMYYNNDVRNQQQIINATGQLQQSIASSQAAQRSASGLQGIIGGLFGGGGGTGGGGGSGGLLGALFNQFGKGGGDVNPNFNLDYADYTAQQAGYSSYAAMTAAGAV
jgi:hypothetical protein